MERIYYDMTPESRSHPLLDDASLSAYPLQRLANAGGCCAVDASSHDNECVRKPESRNSPLLDNASLSAYP
jgi:hypothetical protein